MDDNKEVSETLNKLISDLDAIETSYPEIAAVMSVLLEMLGVNLGVTQEHHDKLERIKDVLEIHDDKLDILKNLVFDSGLVDLASDNITENKKLVN